MPTLRRVSDGAHQQPRRCHQGAPRRVVSDAQAEGGPDMTIGAGIAYPLGEDETPLRCSVCGHTWVGYDDQDCPSCQDHYFDEHPNKGAALHGTHKPTSWVPVDLGPALAGDDIPPPTVLARDD